MSDWLRAFSILPFLSLALICAAWAAGGWLLVRSLFRLRPGEALLSGVAAGYVLYLEGLNLLAHVLSMSQACWAAALLILLGGLVTAWRSHITLAELRGDLSGWVQILALLFLVFIFMTIKRGVSMYDDTTHLPLVSVMGSGDIPPHFYLYPSAYFAYHYGLQLFAAALESVGRFFPWSAWDMARAVATALTLVLGWVWVRRFTRSSVAGVLGSFLFVFGGGTRWLMLLLPSSVLSWVNSGVQTALSGRDTASTLIKALTHTYVMEGTGSMPFAFAFQNGDFEPVFFNLGATGALPFLTILLLLLLSQTVPSVKRPWALVVVTLVFANLALSAEHVFAVWWGAILIVLLAAVVLGAARRARAAPVERDEWLGWLLILAGSAVIALLQGGYISETARSILAGGLATSASQNTNVYGFGLRWPPAVIDGHFGTLSLFDPRQLLALLLELGPALLAAPLASVWAWKTARKGQRWQASLGLAALLCFVFPLFVQYGVDRNSTRFTEVALWIWLVLAFPALAYFYRSFRSFWKAAAGTVYGVCVLGGIIIFATMIANVPAPRLADFINPLDLAFTRAYWNRLEPKAQVLDATPVRAVTVFGRASLAGADQYTVLPEWTALSIAPLPQKVNASGYTYIYMSYDWWLTLKPDVIAALQQPCVVLVKEIKAADSPDFRRLLDVRACK
jgi:hypothetical protein